jgi:glycosyltransferase involved in cell wall biosynthesis
LKILYVITRSDVIGGASVHVLDLAHGARLAGHEVLVLVGGTGIFLERAKAKGIRCIALRYLVREINPITDFLCIFELRRYLHKFKPDVVHLHSSKAGILGRIAAKSLFLPVVFTAHGWAFTEGVSKAQACIYRLVERLMARFANVIITVSDYDRGLALEYGVGSGSRIITVHNGMPTASISKDSSATGTAVKLIMVARFEAPKKHLELLDALVRIRALDWTLELVGEGPLFEDVESAVVRYGLTGRVTLSGACDDVERRLSCSDIFLLVSDWEGLPLTILEAMRAGLPVVASKVGGVPEAVEHGATGFLVSRNDHRGLADSIGQLIQSRELREKMGRSGQAKFCRQFSFKCMLEKTLGVYSMVSKAVK